jgi:hypothetical protein
MVSSKSSEFLFLLRQKRKSPRARMRAPPTPPTLMKRKETQDAGQLSEKREEWMEDGDSRSSDDGSDVGLGRGVSSGSDSRRRYAGRAISLGDGDSAG